MQYCRLNLPTRTMKSCKSVCVCVTVCRQGCITMSKAAKNVNQIVAMNEYTDYAHCFEKLSTACTYSMY